jgi:RNA polymerase sigma-70 factor (ECF subfamily)
MTARATESTIELSPLVAVERADSSAIEDEVLALFDDFRDPLLRYVCAFGISISDGEDLIQDVFLALFRHLSQNGARSNLQGWLFRVAHNLALKRRARLRREHGRIDSGLHAAHAVLDPQHDPEEQLAGSQRRTRLMAVLNALPERDRHCVHLRGNGLRYRDIARVLGMSLGGVAKSLTRSLARLHRADEG